MSWIIALTVATVVLVKVGNPHPDSDAALLGGLAFGVWVLWILAVVFPFALGLVAS